MSKHRDVFGNDILVGDEIAYFVVRGHSIDHEIGKVEALGRGTIAVRVHKAHCWGREVRTINGGGRSAVNVLARPAATP